MSEYTISSRSRNLSFEWTNKPVQFHNSRGDGYLGFNKPTGSRDRYGLKGVERAMEQARRINSGNDWTGALFVNGERATAMRNGDDWYPFDAKGDFYLLKTLVLEDGREVTMQTEEK